MRNSSIKCKDRKNDRAMSSIGEKTTVKSDNSIKTEAIHKNGYNAKQQDFPRKKSLTRTSSTHNNDYLKPGELGELCVRYDFVF